jgi:hypothetical protein
MQAREPWPRERIPDSVKRLIAEDIDSVPELEAILLLREHPERDWTAIDAGKRLYVSGTVAAHVLAQLAERGFFSSTRDNYRYAPANQELAATINQLAACERSRRGRLFTLGFDLGRKVIAMLAYNRLLLGAVAMGFLVCGLFSLRFWRDGRDRFFLYSHSRFSSKARTASHSACPLGRTKPQPVFTWSVYSHSC